MCDPLWWRVPWRDPYVIDVTDGHEGLFFVHNHVLCEDECCGVTVLCLDRNGPYSRDGSPLDWDLYWTSRSRFWRNAPSNHSSSVVSRSTEFLTQWTEISAAYSFAVFRRNTDVAAFMSFFSMTNGFRECPWTRLLNDVTVDSFLQIDVLHNFFLVKFQGCSSRSPGVFA